MPSYRATREEEHATRGRSRLLFEMLDGHDDAPITDGWRSTEVLDALDLCLSCKGCCSDCPMHVDMATYKAEFLAHHYAGRLRPRAALLDGLAAGLGARSPRSRRRAVNRSPTRRASTALIKAAGGVAQERTCPHFGRMRFTTWFERLDRRGDLPRGDGSRGEVLLWPDTFSNHLSPRIGVAAVEVLEAAGFTVGSRAGAVLRPDLDLHRPAGHRQEGPAPDGDGAGPVHVRAGTPVVGLEPSCTAVFRADAKDLFPEDRTSSG